MGAVAVPLNPQFKQDELELLLPHQRRPRRDRRRAGIAVAERIVDGWDDSVPLVTTGPARGRALSFDRLIEQHPGARLAARAADEDFVFMYSSGSTGPPEARRRERTGSAGPRPTAT